RAGVGKIAAIQHVKPGIVAEGEDALGRGRKFQADGAGPGRAGGKGAGTAEVGFRPEPGPPGVTALVVRQAAGHLLPQPVVLVPETRIDERRVHEEAPANAEVVPDCDRLESPGAEGAE